MPKFKSETIGRMPRAEYEAKQREWIGIAAPVLLSFPAMLGRAVLADLGPKRGRAKYKKQCAAWVQTNQVAVNTAKPIAIELRRARLEQRVLDAQSKSVLFNVAHPRGNGAA